MGFREWVNKSDLNVASSTGPTEKKEIKLFDKLLYNDNILFSYNLSTSTYLVD